MAGDWPEDCLQLEPGNANDAVYDLEFRQQSDDPYNYSWNQIGKIMLQLALESSNWLKFQEIISAYRFFLSKYFECQLHNVDS